MQSPAPRLTPRQRARQQTEAEVLRIGNRLLDQHGAAGLSLREIARELGMVSSALYRYVSSREELLTLLIANAYNNLADAVEAALPGGEPALEPIALAMLDWSAAHPRRWALLYGTPLENYQAPAEQTTQPGTRVMVLVARAVLAASPGTPPPLPSGSQLEQLLASSLEDLGLHASTAQAAHAISIWVSLTGMITALRFNQLGPGFDAVERDLLTAHVRLLDPAHSIGS